MRASLFCAGVMALLFGCERRPVDRVATTPALAPCRPGDLARTTAGPTAFTGGWVQLKLMRCPTPPASPGAAVEVEFATADLAFKAGAVGGSTLGVLAAASGTSRAAVDFPLRHPLAPAAERIVLAPWTGAGTPPTIGAVAVVRRPALLPME